jgi:uncharacterized protein YwgA
VPKEQRKKTLDLFTIGDLIDKAIVFLATNNTITTLSLQKAIFLYLYSYAVTNGYDFNNVLRMASFEPYRFGPFSDAVVGQAETLVGYGKIRSGGSGEKQIFGTIDKGLEKLNLSKDEKRLLTNIKKLVETLEPMELTFYIYFNPLIDQSLRDYFTSKSEIKDSLLKRKDTYVRDLLKKGAIDEETAELMIYGNNQDTIN